MSIFQDPSTILMIFVAVICLLFVVYLFYTHQTAQLKQIAREIIDDIETNYATEGEEIRYKKILDQIYPKIPSLITIILPKSVVDNMLEKIVAEIKERTK